MTFLRLLLILLGALTVVFFALSFYSRSVRREKLENHWHTKGLTGSKDAFIQRGLKKYDGSLRRKLILGVYVVPLTFIAIVVYVTNFM